MKKSKAFIRLAAAFMAAIMALSLCACGDSRDNAASTGESSEEIQLTAEQQVEKLLLEEFEKNYGDNLETCEFRNIKIFTAEEIAENDELFSDYNFVETDIVFSASYDLKAPDGKDVAPLLPANGEEDGQWVREKYVCGNLTLNANGEYELDNIGTGF